jgi:hypothetical protein
MPINVILDTIAMDRINLEDLECYFAEYLAAYRREYETFVSAPPRGPGYPKVTVSPYLGEAKFDVYLSTTGIIVNQTDVEPAYKWYIAGGPAIKVDYEPTVTPTHVSEILKANDLVGKNIGIYRIVAKKTLPNKVWKGRIEGIIRSSSAENLVAGISVNFYELNITLAELVNTLTFGAFGSILHIRLPENTNDIGYPHIFRRIGIYPADLNHRRFFEYLEIHGQVDRPAWDIRAINLRVKSDLRRDFAQALSATEDRRGASLSFGATTEWAESYTNRLVTLQKAIDLLRKNLLFNDAAPEHVFHRLLENNPILVDVYGVCQSKPVLKYPAGHSSIIGKDFLVPDFIVLYPDQSYKLVEIERPSKSMATKAGQPRAELTQAIFQIAEWKHFIKTHYDAIRDNYPGIQSKCKSMIIMSRSKQKAFGGLQDLKAYAELLMEQYNVDEVLTYDDILERACLAYYQLTGLAPSSI